MKDTKNHHIEDTRYLQMDDEKLYMLQYPQGGLEYPSGQYKHHFEKCYNFQMEAISLTLNISANS